MRLITLAIHTYDRALAVKTLLEAEGIAVTLQNVNLEQPEVSSGVRVRIPEADLPLALRIVENPELFSGDVSHHPSALLPNRSILVPTDFCEHSFHAAQVAVRLAAARNTEVTFLNAYIDPGLSGSVQLSDNLTYGADAEATQRLVATANDNMKEFMSRIKSMMKKGQLPVVRCRSTVVEGVPEEAIIEFAKMNVPYLVVMGTRATKRKERELIGSVTAEVLDDGRFSVLSVPETVVGELEGSPHNILFFSNLDQEDIIAMDTLYRFFPNAHADVTIVHIPQRRRFTDRAAGKSAMALGEYCSKTFSHFNFQTVPISPKTAIDELSKLQAEHNYDLLVVPNRRKNAISRFFNPGLAHKILFEADIPMLVIPV